MLLPLPLMNTAVRTRDLFTLANLLKNVGLVPAAHVDVNVPSGIVLV